MVSKTTVNLVILLLGVGMLLSLGGAVYLISVNQTVPDQLWNVVTFLAGALAAMLASVRGSSELPPPAPPVEQPVL